jgi:hypothetical protein
VHITKLLRLCFDVLTETDGRDERLLNKGGVQPATRTNRMNDVRV